MNPDDILAHPARILTAEQRRTYFETGFVAIDAVIPEHWLARLTVLFRSVC